MAEAVHTCLGVPVRLMPNRVSPLKKSPGASETQRAEMLALAVEGRPGLGVDLTEYGMSAPSFTVETLSALKARHNAPIIWALGADAFNQIQAWVGWPRLLELANLLVVTRPGIELEPPPAWREDQCSVAQLPQHMSGYWSALTVPPVEGSATNVRNARKNGQTWKHWVTESVAHYIEENGLYE